MVNLLHNKKNSDSAPAEEWVRSTSLFAQWKAMKEQIMLHKWYESEKAGHDIGWDKAAANWMIHHRSEFTSESSNSRDS